MLLSMFLWLPDAVWHHFKKKQTKIKTYKETKQETILFPYNEISYAKIPSCQIFLLRVS